LATAVISSLNAPDYGGTPEAVEITAVSISGRTVSAVAAGSVDVPGCGTARLGRTLCRAFLDLEDPDADSFVRAPARRRVHRARSRGRQCAAGRRAGGGGAAVRGHESR